MSAVALLKFIKHLPSPLRERETNRDHLNRRPWRLLQVDSTIACNLRCVMCPWKEIRSKAKNHGIMSQEIWEAIKPYLPEARIIDFTGGGEPLLQPRLQEWITDAKSAGCETGILTNGFLMNQEMAQRLMDAGLDMVCVSMDGATAEVYNGIRIGSDFEIVCENLANITRMRVRKRPKTSINFVIMRMNLHQIEDMVRLAADLGVAQVNFKQCDVIRGEHGRGLGLFHTEETEEIRRLKKRVSKARGLAKKLNLQVTTTSFTPEERPVCEQDPRNSLFIRHDGAVGPCINLTIGGATTFLGRDLIMPTIHYGFLPNQDLKMLWEAETCKYYRDLFGRRAKSHEEAILKSMVGTTPTSREKILKAAIEAMPGAPEGCRVCHYLYDI